jgi:SAM-dependent methyltransferase
MPAGAYRAVERLAHQEHPRMPGYLRRLFRGIDLRGLRILDVGSGSGLAGFYGSAMGAREVVCLEPEESGATNGSRATFETKARALAHLNVRLDDRRLQDFWLSDSSRPFDLALLHHTINHLNEDACELLREASWARDEYKRIFSHLRSLVRDGGVLIAADCARRNLFADLGLRNPLAPDIEWSKHQSPRVWCDVLSDSGWTPLAVRWTVPSRLGDLGQRFFANRLTGYLSTSHFILYARATHASDLLGNGAHARRQLVDEHGGLGIRATLTRR